MTNDLTVIYRAYGGELTPETFKPGRPSWFNKERCWDSFCNSFLGENRAEIHVVWDGEIDNRLFEAIKIKEPKITIHKINEKSNQKSLASCYDLAGSLNNKYIAFIEDDWLFLDGAYKILLEGLNKFYGHFVFPYDSPHRYDLAYQDVTLGQDYLALTDNSHWRTAESLMCSVAMNRQLFNEVKQLLLKFCFVSGNAPNDRGFYRECLKYGIRCWTSIPTQCSHVINTDLGPFVDWSKI